MGTLNELTNIYLIRRYELNEGVGKKAAFYRRELKRCQKYVDKFNENKPITLGV